MRTSRLNKLERHARSRPCPGCGREFQPVAGEGEGDWDRLSKAEQNELARLVAATTTPACARCGRSGFDLAHMTDGQLDRALQLLRKVYGELPLPPGEFG